MRIGKLCLAAFLGAMPAVAAAQPSVRVDVGVNVGADSYDTVAPGDPVESVDVFYDELSPYGVWVDEPDVGRVFVPDTANYVPYTTGHWQYTSLGFVWISTEPHAWATSHYGRWAYSNNYRRWYWLPDTGWGPAWVEWRQTGDDFGWAPLPPDIVVRAGWQPPVDSWHYCSASHVLDVNVVRYYEPRERVVTIHRAARPVDHYSTVSNVRVVVGPPAAVLRERHVVVRPVKVEPRTVGRWTPTEARAQVERAREHRATFEVQNQRRIESNAQIRTAHVKVVEAHPQIRAQVTARVQAAGRAEPSRGEPGRPGQPPRVEPQRTAPGQKPPEPARVEPGRPGEPAHVAPKPAEHPPAQRPPAVAPKAPEPQRPEPQRREPNSNQPRAGEHATPAPAPRAPEQHGREGQRPEPQRAAPKAPEPQRAAPQRPEPQRAAPKAPEPQHAAPKAPEPQRAERKEPDRKEPERKQPDRKEPDRKDSDRKEPDRH